MKVIFKLLLIILLFQYGCSNKNKAPDASGNFEADEILVSAEQTGRIMALDIKEGAVIGKDVEVGQIDVSNIRLQKQQVEATLQSLIEKTRNPLPQINLVKKELAVQRVKLEHLIREKERTQRLLASDAATKKQLDDLFAEIDQLQKQMDVTQQQLLLSQSTISEQNRSVLSETSPLKKSAEQIQDLINKGRIINPLNGTVLVRYAYAGEITSVGKPLYSIANLDTITLKAYVTGIQLPQLKLNQKVTVRIDNGTGEGKMYPGTIYWISDKAEFTPKTIQTKEERANLVYATRIRVKNDGFLKIGMYADVLFSPETTNHGNTQ
jgi:HlyD family secretion protein